MRCLDLRLAEVDAVVGALVAADAELISTANGAVARLPLVADCADPVDTIPRPGDPAARTAIERAEADVARAKALIDLGQLATARELAEGAIAVSEHTRWTPLAAQALIELGKTQSRLREADAALATFDRAAQAAAQASDDTRLAEALIQRFYMLTSVDRIDEAFAGKQYVEVVVERAGGSPYLRAMWLSMLASGLEEQGHHKEALDTQLEATALMRQAVDADNIILSDCLNNEATYRMNLGQLDEAKAILEGLLVTDAATHGPGHPELARRHYNLGNIAWQRGELDAGLAHFEKAYAIRKATGTVDWVAPFGLADHYEDVGRWSAARPLFVEALAFLERTQKGSPWVMYAHVSLGALDFQLGNLDDARVWFEKVRAAPQFPSSPGRHEIAAYLALIAVAEGDLRSAKRLIAESYEVAKPIPNASFGVLYLAEAEVALSERGCGRIDKFLAPFAGREDKFRSIGTAIRIIRAECQLATGTAADKQAARDALDAHLADVDSHAPEPGATARLRFALARALVATGGDRDRARSLAEGARDGFATLGDPGRRHAAEVARWLAVQR
jgi:tetratricopeptide (TPR) repeat protein